MVEVEVEQNQPPYAIVHGVKLKLQCTLGKVVCNSLQGFYAAVYLDEARQAVKVYHTHTKLLSFEKEVATLQVLFPDDQHLSHPNIVRLINFDTQTLTLVSSFGGVLLRDYIYENGDVVDFEAIARQLLESIIYIHEQGLGHGDLKLDNLLWYDLLDPRNQESMRLCLIDFNQSGPLSSLWKGSSLLARDTLSTGRCLLRMATGHWVQPTKSLVLTTDHRREACSPSCRRLGAPGYCRSCSCRVR